MMTEQESLQIYEALSEYVREHRLDWILEQVTEQIRFGVEEKKSVRVGLDEVWAADVEEPRSRRSKVLFAATRPYLEREKLKLLIDAVQQAVVNTTEMEASFREALQRLDGPRNGILVREELNPKLIEIDGDSQAPRHAEARLLGKLLNELREEV